MLFLEEAGRIYLANSSMEALREAQLAFEEEAERVGLKTEEDESDDRMHFYGTSTGSFLLCCRGIKGCCKKKASR